MSTTLNQPAVHDWGLSTNQELVIATSTGDGGSEFSVGGIASDPPQALASWILLVWCGFVNDPNVDNSAALQQAIIVARTKLNGALVLPSRIKTIRLDSGITADLTQDSLESVAPIFIDASHMTSGAVLTIDSTMTDGNVVPLYTHLREFKLRWRMVGSGSPTVAGAVGVVGIKVRGTNGKAYQPKVMLTTFDGFETSVDLGGNEFSAAFERCTFRPAMNGTSVRALTGDGVDYGERWNFSDCMFYNGRNATAIYNEVGGSDWMFENCSFDYNKTQIHALDGRIYLTECHIETKYDEDYQFKVYDGSGNGTTLLSIKQSTIVMNQINRTAFEIFDIADTVELGGIFLSDTPIYHNSQYGLATYVRGNGRAIVQNSYGFAAQYKVPFSKRMSRLEYGFETANAISVFTLSDGAKVIRSNSAAHTGTYSLTFAADAALQSASFTTDCRPGQQVRSSYWYIKSGGAAAGQGKLQIVVNFQNKSAAGTAQTLASYTIRDQDGDQATWALQVSGTSVCAPAGTTQVEFKIQKSADAGAVALLRVDDLVLQVA